MDSNTGAWILGFGILAVLLIFFAFVVVSLFLIIPTWRICNRAGYSGAISLLHLIPGVGTLIVFAILAFGTWPNGEATPPQPGAR